MKLARLNVKSIRQARNESLCGLELRISTQLVVQVPGMRVVCIPLACAVVALRRRQTLVCRDFGCQTLLSIGDTARCQLV